MRRIAWIYAALIGVMVLVPSCSTDYVTGKSTFSLVSESQELAMGREADPQIVAEYGLYEDEQLATFFRDLGVRMAKVSHRPQLEYTFRVLDTPVVNAFALPGGFTYVTRGILAHFNSEDELAGVLGHEIGHVVARHSAEQMSRQQLAGLGLGLGAIMSETFARYVNVAGTGVGLLFLSFSRGQETESDQLGVEYSTKLGYDSHRMAGFFGTLERLGGDSGQSIPGFLSTHPDPGDREANVHALTDQWQKQVEYKPLNKNPDDYLRMIDGIVYGNNPRQGYVQNNTFYHPEMTFKFPIPQGWDLVNSPSTVRVANSDKSAIVLLRLGAEKTATAEADAFAGSEGITVIKRTAVTVNGFPAQTVESTAASQDQDLGVLSYFIEKDGNVFTFHGFSLATQFSSHAATMRSVMAGFALEKDPAILNKKPRRLKVKPAPRSSDLASTLSALGMPGDMHKELAIINGMELSDRVSQGKLIKIVVDG